MGTVLLTLRRMLLGLFCLAAAVPVVIFWAWPQSHALQSQLQDVRERHLVIAQNLARTLERYGAELKSVVGIVGQEIDDLQFRARIAPMLASLSISHVCIVDPVTGQILVSTDPLVEAGKPFIPAERMAEFEGLLANSDGEAVLTGVYPHAKLGNAIYVIRRVRSGIVMGTVGTDQIVELGRSIKFGRLGHAAIVDHNGRAVSHPRDDWQANRKDMSGIAPVKAMLAGGRGVSQFYSPALKADMIAGYQAVKGIGWGAMVPQPLSELVGKAHAIDVAILLVLAVGLVVAAVLAFVAAHIISRPIEGVVGLVERVGRGEALGFTDLPSTQRLAARELRIARASVVEMSARMQANLRTISKQANYDELTELPNRRRFFRDLAVRHAGAMNGNTPLVIACLDLDGFKQVNDLHGHPVGDALLREAAQRLTTHFGSLLVPYRLGGDEFALMLPSERTDEELSALGRAICDVLSESTNIDGKHIVVSASVGFARAGERNTTPEILFEQADFALYRVKEAGRDGVVLFGDEHDSQMRRTTAITKEIQRDGFLDELTLVYQPIVSSRSGECVKFEALARWNSPVLGSVPPDDFIGVAERSDRIHAITEHLLSTALEDAAQWVETVQLSFNLSSKDLANPVVAMRLGKIVRDSGFDPHRIQFEITETAIMQDLDLARASIRYLRSMGI
ncbi:diguanylate cyclase, partial [Rhizobiaceae bacterium]|nr:diguanylate cyclase [Rhizobiaceae bacterium]